MKTTIDSQDCLASGETPKEAQRRLIYCSWDRYSRFIPTGKWNAGTCRQPVAMGSKAFLITLNERGERATSHFRSSKLFLWTKIHPFHKTTHVSSLSTLFLHAYSESPVAE